MKIRNTPFYQVFAGMCDQLGLLTRNDGTRMDAAGETMFIAKTLEHVAARTYDVMYATAKARTFMPVNNAVHNGARTFVYHQWDHIGLANWITNYATDFESVNAFVKEFDKPIYSMGTSYQYSVQDLRAAQLARTPLNEKLAAAARLVVEQKIDDVAAFGDSVRGIEGFTNHSAVSVISPVNGTWDDSTTGAEMVADLQKLAMAPEQVSKQLIVADTLVLPLDVQPFLMKPMGAEFSSTVLDVFKRSGSTIKNIEFWHKTSGNGVRDRLTGSPSAGVGVKRAIAYKKDAQVLELVIPQEFEQFNPQQVNMAFYVPCHARIGGVNVFYPFGMTYMDLGDAPF